LTLCSVSEMYPTAVVWLFWARDSVWIALQFWLPCHSSKKSWIVLATVLDWHFGSGSGLSTNPNCQFWYCLIDISLPVWIRWVPSGLYRRSICKFTYNACPRYLNIVYN
jgi:hypothetical protein